MNTRYMQIQNPGIPPFPDGDHRTIGRQVNEILSRLLKRGKMTNRDSEICPGCPKRGKMTNRDSRIRPGPHAVHTALPK